MQGQNNDYGLRCVCLSGEGVHVLLCAQGRPLNSQLLRDRTEVAPGRGFAQAMLTSLPPRFFEKLRLTSDQIHCLSHLITGRVHTESRKQWRNRKYCPHLKAQWLLQLEMNHTAQAHPIRKARFICPDFFRILPNILASLSTEPWCFFWVFRRKKPRPGKCLRENDLFLEDFSSPTDTSLILGSKLTDRPPCSSSPSRYICRRSCIIASSSASISGVNCPSGRKQEAKTSLWEDVCWHEESSRGSCPLVSLPLASVEDGTFSTESWLWASLMVFSIVLTTAVWLSVPET